MAIVYVVTKGCYSDYHICAVTLDKEKAERLCKVIPPDCGDEPEIEEWDTEQHEDLLAGRKPYFVIFLENGDVFTADEKDWGVEYFEPGITETWCNYERKNVPALRVELYAENKEAAIKIAAERRAKYLAVKEGIS